MAIYEFEGCVPSIASNAYVDEDAKVIGDVRIGEQCFIGPGARISGDYGTIIIGNTTNIQENCALHARINETCSVGNHVHIGHGALIHNCTVLGMISNRITGEVLGVTWAAYAISSKPPSTIEPC
jgi:carbonic anhydrase/acetyltransferase-like protein (isoleucine patch superfamily)